MIVIGALLVPALSLPTALLAILVGAVAGNVLLGIAAAIGADARVPGMVVLRAPLGQRGSWLPTAFNVAQNVGWSTFELIIIATAAAAASERIFGWEGKWLWTLVFGALSWALGMLGPIGFVRRYLRKVASWALLFCDGLPHVLGDLEVAPARVLERAGHGRLHRASARRSTS